MAIWPYPDNYVQINSDNNGQIEIGTASGQGNVLIGNETNGTQVAIYGEMFIRERARFFKGAEEQFATLTGQVGTVDHDCSNGHVFYPQVQQAPLQQTLQT